MTPVSFVIVEQKIIIIGAHYVSTGIYKAVKVFRYLIVY